MFQCVQSLAHMFVTVGMCDQAVSAYLKLGQVKEAIDSCVELNQVMRAIHMFVWGILN